jgi:tetratricopeptide (TPR) repeat protein
MRLVPFSTLLCVALLAGPICGTSAAAAAPAAAPAASSGGAAVAGPAEVTPDPIDSALAVLADRPTPAVAAATRARLEALWNRSGSDAADLLMRRAGRLVEVDEQRAAFGLLDAAVALTPGWAEGRRRRAMLRLSHGQPEAAQTDLEAALRAEPRHFPSMSLLAAVHEVRGNRAAALDWLRRAAALDPTDTVLGDRLKALAIEVEGRDI